MKVLTTQEVAELLKVNIRTILNLIQRNELKAKKVGRGYKIMESEVKRYLSEDDSDTE